VATVLANRSSLKPGLHLSPSQGRTIWIVDAHGYGKRFVVRADEMLTASIELQINCLRRD